MCNRNLRKRKKRNRKYTFEVIVAEDFPHMIKKKLSMKNINPFTKRSVNSK